MNNFTRRDFVKTAAVSAAAVSTFNILGAQTVNGLNTGKIKVGLIGCGGRGTGALDNFKEAAELLGIKVEVVAVADAFKDKVDGAVQKFGLSVERGHFGFTAYQIVANSDAEVVIMATPPNFRPVHFEACVEAGKHCFIEKPVAVDPVGARKVIEVGELAKSKGLTVIAGTQRRHQKNYLDMVAKVKADAIGEIVGGAISWNMGVLWKASRKPGMSNSEFLARNWLNFTEMSGDHIVEQHVHNLDIMNWVLGTHPVRAVSGLGGRQVRIGDRHGHIFDHFAVEFEYPGGISMFSQSRQINGCRGMVGEAIVGTDGTSNCKDRIEPNEGERWRFRERESSAYKKEHEDLIASIRAGNPINEAQAVAESTMTGIIGREAVYSGQAVEWDAAMKSTTRLGPEEYKFGPYPIPPVAMPGKYKFT